MSHTKEIVSAKGEIWKAHMDVIPGDEFEGPEVTTYVTFGGIQQDVVPAEVMAWAFKLWAVELAKIGVSTL